MSEQFQFALLSHMHAYRRMTTQRVVAHHFGLPHETAADVLKQLVAKRLAAENDLTPEESYYHLQPPAAEVLRVGSISGEPLVGTRKIVAYATLHFCCLGPVYRPRIPESVFPSRFPGLFQKRMSGGGNLDHYTEGATLGYIRVEHPDSMPGDVIRIIQRARKDVGQRTFGNKGPGLTAFRDLVDERRFVIALLTPFQSRADRITDAVNREKEIFDNYHAHLEFKQGGKRTPPYQFIDFATWHRKDRHRLAPLAAPPLEVHVIPELIQLIYPGSNSKPQDSRNTPTRKNRRRKRPVSNPGLAPASIRKVAKQFDFRDQTGPFDIIGDVHGCTDELQRLLAKLGYEKRSVDGHGPGWADISFAAPEGRRAIFLGNIVDHGPKILDAISMVRNMVNAGTAFCVPGSSEMQLLENLRGLNTKNRPSSLQTTLLSIGRVSNSNRQQFRNQLMEFLAGLPVHLVLNGGKLVAAHAGLSQKLHGRNSKESRSFAIDGPGMPDWAAGYRGDAAVVYGHTPVKKPIWMNNTISIDTACVSGGHLTALRYPERELTSVRATRAYCEPLRPFIDVPTEPQID